MWRSPHSTRDACRARKAAAAAARCTRAAGEPQRRPSFGQNFTDNIILGPIRFKLRQEKKRPQRRKAGRHHVVATDASPIPQEVEDFVLERFQQNLVRSLTDIDGSHSPFFDVCLHLGALVCACASHPDADCAKIVPDSSACLACCLSSLLLRLKVARAVGLQ